MELSTIKRIQVMSSIVMISALIIFSSCDDFVDVGNPKKELTTVTVFSDEATASAAIAGLYFKIWSKGYDIALLTGLTSDELYNFSASDEQAQFFENALLAGNGIIFSVWATSYETVYGCNSAIQALRNSPMEKTKREQLEGEARFIRALSYFYLVNLFGEVPMVLDTDYEVNAVVSRSEVALVYNQILEDLKTAKNLLSEDYTNNSRVRANKSCASALLARVYLFLDDSQNAIEESSNVIDNVRYSLENDLSNVVKPNNSEAILQFFPVFYQQGINTFEGANFILTSVPFNVSLSESVINSFDEGDLRKSNWIGEIPETDITYYFPFKYKVQYDYSIREYVTALRLAEQYLIRAEAHAKQGAIANAIVNLNIVRLRSGLSELPNTLSKDEVLEAIFVEREREFFCEWGHRWLDLKRTGKATDVLKPLKADWQETDKLWPIPQREIQNNPSLSQNQGYN